MPTPGGTSCKVCRGFGGVEGKGRKGMRWEIPKVGVSCLSEMVKAAVFQGVESVAFLVTGL